MKFVKCLVDGYKMEFATLPFEFVLEFFTNIWANDPKNKDVSNRIHNEMLKYQEDYNVWRSERGGR